MKVQVTNQQGKEVKLLEDQDGSPKFCPLKPPVPTQNNLGSLSFIEFPCTSSCACFQLDFISSPGEIIFTCSATNLTADVEYIAENTGNTGKITPLFTDL
jgi:hypothetical protein